MAFLVHAVCFLGAIVSLPSAALGGDGKDTAICSRTADEPRISFETEPRGRTVASGGALHLECEVFSVPPATLHWERDGERVDAPAAPSASLDDADAETEANEKVGVLVATAMTRAELRLPCVDAAASYACVAVTACGTKRAVAHVRVDGESSGKCQRLKTSRSALARARPPQIDQWTDSRLERYDAAARLLCRAAGSPPPNVRWLVMDDEGEFRSVQDDQSHLTLPSGDLLVNGFDEGSGGRLYQCLAENPFGMASVETVLIEVEYDGPE